jgi:hypothetical protein
MLKVAFLTHDENLHGKSVDYQVTANPTPADGYTIQEIDDETFFPGRAAAIYLRLGGKTQRIGEFGVLHPSVLGNYDLKYVFFFFFFRLSFLGLTRGDGCADIFMQIPGQHARG